jgi:hypothetical protein
MYGIKGIIRKKLNSLGLRKKFDELEIRSLTEKFLKEQIKNIRAVAISYFNGSLMIQARNAVEANELHFFQEELKFFLEKEGYKIKKVRIIS